MGWEDERRRPSAAFGTVAAQSERSSRSITSGWFAFTRTSEVERPGGGQKVSGDVARLRCEFPTVTTLNLGERAVDDVVRKLHRLAVVGALVKEAFEAFAAETGRELKLEIEPGTFLWPTLRAVVLGEDKVTTGTAEVTVFKARHGRPRSSDRVLRFSTRSSPSAPTVNSGTQAGRRRRTPLRIRRLLTPAPDEPKPSPSVSWATSPSVITSSSRVPARTAPA